MPIVDVEKCTGCQLCYYACPAEAISLNDAGKAFIDNNKCFECGVCIRICPTKAIYRQELPYPLNIKLLSDPSLPKITGIPGRGTDEVKTNDVTGRYRKGEVGITIDVGRPNVGTTLADVEKIIQALLRAGVELEEENPQMLFLEDKAEGRVKPELKSLKILSMVVEGKTKLENLPRVIEELKKVENEVNTVFSIGIICRINEDYTIPCYDALKQLGVEVMPFAKVNLGLGKPLVLD